MYGKSNMTMSDWSKSNGLATARYPAGMASYWNWEAYHYKITRFGDLDQRSDHKTK